MDIMGQSHGEALRTPVIEADTLPYSYIAELQQQVSAKIFDPTITAYATDELTQLHQAWQADGKITVFTTGVFDMLHMDHAGYLLHTKASGASLLYERGGQCWQDLSPKDQIDFTSEALSSDKLRLIVSVDADKSVAAKKSNQPSKGDTTRPIYGWQTRALTVASQTFVAPGTEVNPTLLSTVDAVTIHGPADFPPDSPHHSHFTMAEHLKPSAWVFFGESKEIFEQAPRRPGLGAVALKFIQDGEGTHYFEDRFLGKISTTKILSRAIGKPIQ